MSSNRIKSILEIAFGAAMLIFLAAIMWASAKFCWLSIGGATTIDDLPHLFLSVLGNIIGFIEGILGSIGASIIIAVLPMALMVWIFKSVRGDNLKVH